MSFWVQCSKSNSSIDCLNTKNPLHRMQVFQALEDPITCGEWTDPGHQALLYGGEEGVIVYVYDIALRLILDKFFNGLDNQNKLIKIKAPL